MNSNEYDIDFYSNDHQEDLMITATVTSYGEWRDFKDEFEIISDPEFTINEVHTCDGDEVDLSKEEKRRVNEILTNNYWNEVAG